MNFRALGDNDLSDFAQNVFNQLNGGDITAIDANVRRDLSNAIGGLPATLAVQTATAAVSEDSRKAAVSARNETKFQIQAVMSQVRDALKAGLAPKKQYDLLGFDYAKERAVIIANTPTNLVATGTSNGVNRISFNGNNRPGTVVYEIWRLNGDTAPYAILATTRKQIYIDTPVTPGEYYNYKVRAVAATNVSAFSNIAVVYGASRPGLA